MDITISNGKVPYFYGHFPVRYFDKTRGYPCHNPKQNPGLQRCGLLHLEVHRLRAVAEHRHRQGRDGSRGAAGDRGNGCAGGGLGKGWDGGWMGVTVVQ